MTAKVLIPAKFVDCPGITNEGVRIHSMRDNCWSCAPYWERIPVCPTDSVKLKQPTKPTTSKIGYCRTCRKHYDTSEK